MSAPLDALRTAILTNTLNAGQQTALANALAVISPAFPEPDEISNSIPQEEEILARDWMAALYAVQAGGGTGGLVPVSTGTIIVPDAAALSGTVVTGLPNGQPAIVDTFGAVFYLQPKGTLVVDGSTVLASTDATRVWERGESTVIETARAQTDWFVSSAGSDENTGADAGHPVKTNAEVYRRWGNTWEPNLSGVHAFTVHALTPSTDGTDPTFYRPNLEDGATFTQISPLPAPSFTGTLLAVTPKAPTTGTGNALLSTFTPTTGAIVSGLVLVNTTRGNSRALALTDTGGGNWLITQPFTPYTGGFPGSTEVNTWANGDAIIGYAMTQVDIARVGARAATFNGTFAPAHLIQNITIIDGNGNFGDLIVDSNVAAFEDVPCGRPVTVDNDTTFVSENAAFESTLNAFSPETAFSGGFLGGGFSNNLVGNPASTLLNEVIVIGPLTVQGGAGFFAVDTAGSVAIYDTWQVFAGGVIYGARAATPGSVDVSGTLQLATSAAANLPLADGTHVTLNGKATGYSQLTGGGGLVTTHGGIALTHAAIDAAAGPAGFGGYAFGGGASIVVAGAQP